MKYTSLTLPHRKPRLTHKTVFYLFAFLISVTLFVVLAMNYLKIDTENIKLAQQISKMSSTKPVAAITTPEASDAVRESLIPVDKADVAELIEKIRAIAVVPLDEAPTLATIIDVSKILDQPFFRSAQVDDKLMIYSAARTAVLYRPAEGKIVNMAYLVDGQGTEAQSPSAQRPQVQGVSKQASSGAQLQVKLAVYYATDSSQLRSKVGKALSSLPNVEVSREALTRGTEYKGVTIIDLTGGHDTVVSALIKSLQGKKGVLPDEEDRPEADILAIVGEEKGL